MFKFLRGKSNCFVRRLPFCFEIRAYRYTNGSARWQINSWKRRKPLE